MKSLPCVIASIGLLSAGTAPVTAETVDPRAVLQEARVATSEGRYEEALEKHVWFHENALETGPALAGVRLSFALTYWMELAERYPPAGDALHAIRDRQTAELENGRGTYNDFLDVASINQVLGEEERTLNLFRRIDRDDPEFARQVYRIVGDTLLDAGEYALLRKYLVDPDAAFDDAHEMYNLHGQMIQENPQMNNPSFRRYREEKFRSDISRFVEILVATGNEEVARNLYEKAAEVTPEVDALGTSVRAAVDRGRRAAAN